MNDRGNDHRYFYCRRLIWLRRNMTAYELSSSSVAPTGSGPRGAFSVRASRCQSAEMIFLRMLLRRRGAKEVSQPADIGSAPCRVDVGFGLDEYCSSLTGLL